MKSIYVTSGETFSGKSALCIGLGLRFRGDGYKVGYMKPVNVYCPLCDSIAFDEDVVFAKQVFEMPEPQELLCPVALTPAKLERQLRGPEVDYAPRLRDVFAQVAGQRDIMVLEGGRSLREGYVAGLPPKKVVELIDAQVLAVMKFDEVLMMDRVLTAQNYFGERLLGAVINEVPRQHAEWVQESVVPYLTRHQIRVFGAVPREQLLSAPSVAELAEGLDSEMLCAAEHSEELVEHMLVGAMGVESALSYFRRKPNKVVVTGGDRADIQLAALETSTRCLVLTGHIYPSPSVLNRAEELGVPVLLTKMDTLAAIEVIETYFGRSRFQQPQKVKRFSTLLNEHLDFAALYKALGISK
jgi:hypothetical protein